MRHEIAAFERFSRIGEEIVRRTIVARLVMLDALKADRVAEREKGVIVGKVARAIQRKRLGRDALVGIEHFLGHVEVLRTSGKRVELNVRAVAFPKRPLLHSAAHIERRVDERVERGNREVHAIAGAHRIAQRRSEIPARR